MIPSAPIKLPVATDKFVEFDTVLSSVLTRDKVYFHPPKNVLTVPIGGDPAVPSLIHVRLGLSKVSALMPVWNVGATEPLIPVRYGASMFPLVSIIVVSGSANFVLEAQEKSTTGPTFSHVS